VNIFQHSDVRFSALAWAYCKWNVCRLNERWLPTLSSVPDHGDRGREALKTEQHDQEHRQLWKDLPLDNDICILFKHFSNMVKYKITSADVVLYRKDGIQTDPVGPLWGWLREASLRPLTVTKAGWQKLAYNLRTMQVLLFWGPG